MNNYRNILIALNLALAIGFTMSYLDTRYTTYIVAACINYFCGIWNLMNALTNKQNE